MPSATRLRVITQSLVLLFLTGCASAPAASGSSSRAGGDVITRAELADPSLVGSTVVDAIRRLRPRFLNERSGGLRGASEGAMVSLNGGPPGELSELSRVEIGDVQEIRYLTTADANLRFGLAGSMRPVLVVTLRPR